MILVALPYHEQKRYALNHLFDWLKEADLPDTEVLMRFHRGTYGEPNAVKTQREFFRRHALASGCSHLLFVGVDTLPPLDCLPRLLAHNLDVVGGLYFGRQNAENGLPDTAVAWIHRKPPLTKDITNTGLITVDGMGMDCVLFSRKALEHMDFLSYEQNDDDYPVYDQLKAHGFPIHLDTSLVCKHYATDTLFS